MFKLKDAFGEEAIVAKEIQPYRKGMVRFRGSWWTARCQQVVTITPDQIVYVIGRQSNTLLVEPAPYITN